MSKQDRGVYMIDIDEAVKLIEKLPYDCLQYSLKSGHFYVENFRTSKTKIGEAAAIECVRTVWKDAKNVFKTKHGDLFPKPPSNYSAKRWNEIIAENHLEEEWYLELRESLLPEITNLATEFGLKEVEAEPELYEKIKKELVYFESKKYEERYSDDILFHFGTSYEHASLTILGNAGMVTGISFFPQDFNGNAMVATMEEEPLGLDKTTSQSLANMLSFYYGDENDENGFAPKNNPFGSDNHFTSIYMNGGTMMRCYLPKSLALRAVLYFDTIKERLESFDEKYKDHPIDNGAYDAFLISEIPFLMEKTIDDWSIKNLFPDVFGAKFAHHIQKTGDPDSWDIALRVVPFPFEDEENPEKIANWAYVAIIADHKTGYVHTAQLGRATNSRPFDDLNVNLEEQLKEYRLPKKIYVDNYLDHLYAVALFIPYIKSKELKIVISKKKLLINEAANALTDEFENGPSAEKTVFKKDIRC